MLQVFLAVLMVTAPVAAGGAAEDSRLLTIEERVAARQAVEAVYRAHVVVSPGAFDEALVAEAARQRVLDDLRLSVALEEWWSAPVSEAALQAELQRIARDTHFPERLTAIYDALGRDPVLVREVFARSVLVRRLARGFFAGDAREAESDWHTWWESMRDSFDPRDMLAPVSTSVSLELPEPESQSANDVGESAACSPDDSWENGSLDDHPDPRHGHGAVWTGTHMIIWGGTINNDRVVSGAIYDPATDSWKPTSTTGAPTPRHDHRAVWTGARMVIWKGAGGGLDGGAYDPATDSWSAVSVNGATAITRYHGLVWTGTDLLEWGGQASGQSNAGAMLSYP